MAPILAAEAAGREEDESALRDKARWYLDAGVEVVWLILPESRDVVVLVPGAESRHRREDRIPAHPALPGLEPNVADFFAQLDRA